jgi:hypothetical protein
MHAALHMNMATKPLAAGSIVCSCGSQDAMLRACALDYSYVLCTLTFMIAKLAVLAARCTKKLHEHSTYMITQP